MKLLIALAFLAFAQIAEAKLTKKEIKYQVQGVDHTGYLVYEGNAKKPGILVVHDWLGLTDKTKAKADELAKMGYVAFAADVYGTASRPKDGNDAGSFAGKYKGDRKLYREKLTAALEQLKSQKNVDTAKLAAIGFCFGGTGVIELARSGADIKGVVSFHGGLDAPDPNAGKNIKTKVLALHGADDPFVKPEELAAFEKEMRDNKIDWQLIKYGGAVHAFTDKTAGNDNSKGAAYNESADRRSKQAMIDFFKEIF